MQAATLALIASGTAKRRRARRGAHRRHHGCQENQRLDSAVPPPALTRVAVEFGLLTADNAVQCTATVETVGNRVGDGGPDRRAGGPADDLRHVQGGGQTYVHDRHAVLEKHGGKSGSFVA